MSSQSTFAVVLQRLLDDTGFFDRAAWARFLEVPTDVIAAWLDDRELPSADNLLRITALLGGAVGVPHEPLERFDGILPLPFSRLSPIKLAIGSTLQDYLDESPLVPHYAESR
jgi:hypothetical protein